jgi:hypothetical protein
MNDKNAVLESAARELEMLARVIRERDIESFDDLTHDISGAYCAFSQICVNTDLCAVREILGSGEL